MLLNVIGNVGGGEHEKRLTDLILKKMVEERRKKQALSDEIIEMNKNVTLVLNEAEKYSICASGQGYEIAKINEYLRMYNATNTSKLLNSIFSLLENCYLNYKEP